MWVPLDMLLTVNISLYQLYYHHQQKQEDEEDEVRVRAEQEGRVYYGGAGGVGTYH
jgi:hypothetical protein